MSNNFDETKAIFDEEGYSDDMGDGPSENAIIVPDFLPPPEELAKARTTNKISIGLDQSSIDFFKEEAKKHGVPYQRMIRNLLDEYVRAHKKGNKE